MKKETILLGIILLIAFVLRFYQLGMVPPSPDWDEAALGYNAYSILHTGRDEYGKFLPIILRSFDDYKPALYAYLTIPALLLFGLTTFAVRFTSAFFGVITVGVTYFLVKEIIQKNGEGKKVTYVALLSAFLLAISPWHIQFSRIGFEANVGLALNVLGVFFFLKGLKKYWVLSLSAFCMALSLYVYQSEKVFTPLLFLSLFFISFTQVKEIKIKYLLTAGILGICFALPILITTFTDHDALARAKGVSVFADTSSLLNDSIHKLQIAKNNHDELGTIVNNRRIVFSKVVVSHYLSHFDLNWLFISGDIARHHAPDMGLLYLWELPFLCIGIYGLYASKWNKKGKILIFAWMFLAPIPASVTSGVPHAVRTINFLPTFQIFTAIGIYTVAVVAKRMISEGKGKQYTVSFAAAIYSLVILLNLGYYLNQYFVQQNIENSEEWQYGYQEAVSYVESVQKDYRQIVVTNVAPIDQSYMFFLFYLQYDPLRYQKEVSHASGGFKEGHAFGKYVFRPLDWSKEEKTSDILYVGRPSDFPSSVKGVKTIYYLNGKPAITIMKG